MTAVPPAGFPLHAFTVDVEDWFQVSACEEAIPREEWDRVPSRVHLGLGRLLDLLERAEVRGTFFVLGWIAERFPGLVAEIRRRGHELGCHSHEHRLVHGMAPEEFRADLRRALDAIEAAAGVRPRLYRAPSFSIGRRNPWALRVLAEEGIEIDSSLFPVRHDRYGVPGAPPGPWRPAEAGGRLVEMPPATVGIGRFRLPCAGGGYLRLYPLALTVAAVRAIERAGRPAVVYVHPWELDPDQPPPPLGPVARWRHRVGLGRTVRRVEVLLSRFRFASLGEVVERLGGRRLLPLVPLGGSA